MSLLIVLNVSIRLVIVFKDLVIITVAFKTMLTILVMIFKKKAQLWCGRDSERLKFA